MKTQIKGNHLYIKASLKELGSKSIWAPHKRVERKVEKRFSKEINQFLAKAKKEIEVFIKEDKLDKDVEEGVRRFAHTYFSYMINKRIATKKFLVDFDD